MTMQSFSVDTKDNTGQLDPPETLILVEGVSKQFGDFQALDRVDLEIIKGTTVALIGASGSGKSTLLRLLAGLEMPSEGRVWINEQDASAMPVQDRDIGFVFQDYALFSHLNVRENIAYGLNIKKWTSSAIAKRVEELLEFIDLKDQGASYPKQLSGGQQQRVALARAIAPKPSILLLDEPFGALDRKLRAELRTWLRDVPIEDPNNPVTTIFVTHDHQEAMEVATEIVILKDGYVKYRVTPEELYYCVLREADLPEKPIPTHTPKSSTDPRPDFRRRKPSTSQPGLASRKSLDLRAY
jgi:sulfate/thiosulfate transport system ATP-binding protein